MGPASYWLLEFNFTAEYIDDEMLKIGQ